MLIALTWLMLSTLIGATAFFGAGVVVALIAGGGVRDRIGRWYISMGQAALRNSALVVRETGSLVLSTVSFDPKYGGDKSTIDGVTGHWRDPLSVKSKLAGKEFGIGLEGASCYISPLAAEVGDEGARRLEQGWLGSQFTDTGDETVTLDYSIPERPQVMDLRKAEQFLKGSCKRRWGKLSNKWAEISQEKFHENISVGQSLLWIGAFAAGVGLAFIVMKYGVQGGGGGGGVEVPIIITALSIPAVPDRDRVRAVLTSTRAQLVYLALGTVAIGVGMIAAAGLLYGLWSGVAVTVGLLVGASTPYLYVRVLFTPAGKLPLGKAFFILGQLTFGAGVLCRRVDGQYEWGRLREHDSGLYMRLDSGRRVDIDGERESLPKVAWAPLAVIEDKQRANMEQFTVDETFRDVRPDPVRDAMVETPVALADGGQGWHLDASKLEQWARDTAGNELPRSGRRKAFEEKGGQQQLSQLWTMIGAGVLCVVGFGMTAGVMLL